MDRNFVTLPKSLTFVCRFNIRYRYSGAEISQKQKIMEKEKIELEAIEQKYNPNNIFNKKQNNIIKQESNQTQLIEYKKSIFRKILTKIKLLLKIK